MNKKLYLIAIILTTFFTKKIVAQNELRFKDIPLIYNLDSLEKALQFQKNNIKNYVNGLIILERNRLIFSSYKVGNHITEIDSLSTLINYPFGKAFCNYARCSNMHNESPSQVRISIENGEKAITQLEKLKDEVGVFYTKMLQISNTSRLIIISNNNVMKSASEIKERFFNLYSKKRNLLLSETYEFAMKQQDIAYILHWNYIRASVYYYTSSDSNHDTAFTNIKKLTYKNLGIIDSHNKYKYHLFVNYNLLGSTYALEKKWDSAIVTFRKTLTLFTHEESLNLALAYFNIANSMFGSKEKKYNQDVISFAEKGMQLLKAQNYQSNLYTLLLCDLLTIKYEELKKYKKAYEYQYIEYSALHNIYEEALALSYETYNDFEKLKSEEIKSKQLEQQKKQAVQRNWLGALIILILCLGIYFIFNANKKLKKAKSEIETLVKFREQFFSIVAHDLRSPINAYQGMAKLISQLLHDKNYTQIEKITTQIDNTGIKLNNLLQNLFEWSLTQQYASNIRIAQINGNEMLEKLLPIYEQIAQNKQQSFIRNIDNPIIIQTDKNIIETILRNLLDNAIKNTIDRGSIVFLAKKEQHSILFSISNETNITDEKFELLHSFINSQQKWQPGEKNMGLGLILIKDFTQKLSGNIVISKEENNLKFEVRLPNS